MARLPYPDRAGMPPEVAGLLGGFPRQTVTEMFAHATPLTEPFLRMAQAQFTGLELTARQRELVILTVAGRIGCEYEYAQHIPISAAAGIGPRLRDDVRDGVFDAVTDPAEHALVSFAAAVVASPTVGDGIFDAVRSHLSPRQIVETLQLVGYYWGLGRICTVLDLEIDYTDGLEPMTGVAALAGTGANATLSDDQVRDFFAATDRGDLDVIRSYLHDDVEVRLGNHEPVLGKDEYTALYRDFTSNFRAVRHEIHDIWHAAGTTAVIVVSMTVHYTSHAGAVVSLPCCNVLHLEHDSIRQYYVYLDLGPAIAPDA